MRVDAAGARGHAVVARATGSRLPAVVARMRRRHIINWRVPPDALRHELPGPWLSPHVIEHHAIVSFCVLELDGITVAPFPPRLGWRSTSCAMRYGVVARTDAGNQYSVYVPERFTDSRLGAWFTRLGFSASHRHVDVSVRMGDGSVTIEVDDGDDALIRATLAGGGEMGTSVFTSVDQFAGFIADGVRSYGRSRHADSLTVLDLEKDDSGYEPLRVVAIDGAIPSLWADHGGEVDSVLRTVAATYRWTYHGLVPVAPADDLIG